MTNKDKIVIGSIVTALLLVSMVFLRENVSADELAQQAAELRIKARRGHCKEIGKKLADCYAGDMATCAKVQESSAWFYSQYNELPEMCSTDPDPLTYGVAQ